ncbi:hypothetical protein D9756_002804 [Leucocoprinus leucothites]|uniref:Wax synthase domain-containing protein n=1 Tax=Leucocoprinus leucothites TaxID=201217 RepID=A0A8H5GBL0_9AGAR|nr:hypothetical protein D9756_002804 [Leucoagaricus leucothites]
MQLIRESCSKHVTATSYLLPLVLFPYHYISTQDVLDSFSRSTLFSSHNCRGYALPRLPGLSIRLPRRLILGPRQYPSHFLYIKYRYFCHLPNRLIHGDHAPRSLGPYPSTPSLEGAYTNQTTPPLLANDNSLSLHLVHGPYTWSAWRKLVLAGSVSSTVVDLERCLSYQEIHSVVGYCYLHQHFGQSDGDNPAFQGKVSLREGGFVKQVVNVGLFWWTIASSQLFNYTLSAILLVSLGIYEPYDWPSLYGRWSDAKSVRKFWGQTWHQLLRRPLQEHGKFIPERILGLAPGSIITSYFQLYTAFLLSGSVTPSGIGQ